MTGPPQAGPPRLIYVAGEDWAFLRHRLPMAQAAQKAGFRVGVATPVARHRQAIEALGVDVFPMRLKRATIDPIGDLAFSTALYRLFRRERPAIVHLLGQKPVLFGTFAARFAGVQAILAAFIGLGTAFTGTRAGRGPLAGLMTRLLRMALKSEQAHVLVQNEDDSRFLAEAGIGAAERRHLIPGSGVDTDAFPLLPPPPAPSAKRPFTAAFVGRFLGNKGLKDLAAAANILKDRGQVIRIVLVGAPDDGHPDAIPKALLARWADGGLMELWGERDDISTVWREAHAAVLPSYREGLPKSLLEAAASGRPMIAYDVPGSRALVNHEWNGLLVPAGSTEALASALSRLAADPALADTLGRQARADVEEKYSARIVASEIRALYQDLAEP